jgi:hexosaminidase
MTFPRACAFAEVAWSGEPADWSAFRTRLEEHLGRLAAAGVEFRPLAGPHPWQ